MSVTCEQIAELLDSGGPAALANDPDAQAHIGTCEDCADRLIASEDLGAAAPPPPDSPLADPPPVDPPPADPPPAIPPPADPPPTLPAQQAAPAPAPEPAPEKPVTWLPPDLQPEMNPDRPPVALPEPDFGGQREYVRIKRLHLVLMALASAMIGGLMVLIAMLLVQPRQSPSSADGVLSEQANDDVSLDLLPLFSVEEDDADPEVDDASVGSGDKKGRKGKGKGKKQRGKATGKRLSKTAISAGIKANISKLGPCFRAARKRKELTPGRHPLVVEFRIMPNGSVQNAALTGPDYLVKKRIAKCVATKLRSWRFPASARASPIRGLQLPINVN